MTFVISWFAAATVMLGTPAAAAPQTTTPCVGDDCQNLHAQLVAAAAGIDRSKTQFVSAVRRLMDSVAGAYGDEAPVIGSSIDDMARGLVAWDKAIQTYRTLLADGIGDSPEAHIALAAVYLERGKGREALKEAATAARLDPWRQDAELLQALAHDLEGQPSEAARALAKASTLTGSHAAMYALAQRLIAIGDEDGAGAALRKFLAAAEKTQRDGNNRPIAAPFVRVGLLRQVPGVAPLFPPALYMDGFARLARGAYDQAVADLKTAAARDALVKSAVARDGDVLEGAATLRRGDLQLAVDRFKGSVEKSSDRSEARRMLGIAYKADEQYDASIEQLRAAVSLNAADDRPRLV